MDMRAFRHTCHHEAGHAFMRWFVGIDTDFVEVLPRGASAVRQEGDRTHVFRGRTMGSGISYPNSPAELKMFRSASIEGMIRSGPVLAEIALLVLAAGPIAEAWQRRKSEIAVWISGNASSDLVDAETIAKLWLPEEPDPIEEACVRARAMLRVPAAVTAISAIAEDLRMKSRLSGAEVAAHCALAFGGRPAPAMVPALVARFEGALSHDGITLADKAFASSDHARMYRSTEPHPFASMASMPAGAGDPFASR